MKAEVTRLLSFSDWYAERIRGKDEDPETLNRIFYHASYRLIENKWRPSTLNAIYLMIRHWFLRFPYDSLRCKVFVSFEATDDPKKLKMTVVRLDNVTQREGTNLKSFYKPIDMIWRDKVGWDDQLVVSFDGASKEEIIIPENPDKEVAELVVEAHPSLKPILPSRRTEIPNNIFEYWHSSSSIDATPEAIKKAISLVKFVNPRYKLQVFGGNMARAYIERHESPAVLAAYDVVKPQAYKTDLWRLVVLYHEGGVYLDSKITALTPFDYYFPTTGGMICDDVPGTGIQNGFFAVPKHDPFIRKSIDLLVKNLNNRDYCDGPFSITGPIALGRLFDTMTPMERSRYKHIYFDSNFIFMNQAYEPLLSQHNGEYRRLHSNPHARTYYMHMWEDRTVYGEPAPPPAKAARGLSTRARGWIITASVILGLLGFWFLLRWYLRRRPRRVSQSKY